MKNVVKTFCVSLSLLSVTSLLAEPHYYREDSSVEAEAAAVKPRFSYDTPKLKPEAAAAAKPRIVNYDLKPKTSVAFSRADVSEVPERYRIPDNLSGLGNQCTLLVARHGSRDKSDPDLNGLGQQEADYLSRVVQNFEGNYRKPVDIVLHSPMTRSIETAQPFMKARRDTLNFSMSKDKLGEERFAKFDRTKGLIDECDTSEVKDGSCKLQAERLVQDINDNYCKRKPDGTPSTLFIVGHGSLGKIMLNLLTGVEVDRIGNPVNRKQGFSHPENGRPYVLTRNLGEAQFRVKHKPL